VFASVIAEAGRLLDADFAGMSRYEPDGAHTLVGVWTRTGAAASVPVGTQFGPGGRNTAWLVFKTGRPALEQPLDQRPAVQIRRTRQGPHQLRPGRRVPQRVGHRKPEPLRITLLALHRHPRRAVRQAGLSYPRRQQERLPAPGRRRYLGDARR
jgi:hypothetical protein